MSSRAVCNDPLEHPAARAWREIQPERAAPGSIAVLRRERRKKRSVYRLDGVGLAGSAVIAKRIWRPTALVERRVYEDILTRLPIPVLHCYEFVEEP
jgi:hypothetical protein